MAFSHDITCAEVQLDQLPVLQVLQRKAITFVQQNAYLRLSMSFLATVTGFLRKDPFTSAEF